MVESPGIQTMGTVQLPVSQLPASGAPDILSNLNGLTPSGLTPSGLTPPAGTVQQAPTSATDTGMAPGIGTLRTPGAPISGGATLGEILAAKGQTIPGVLRPSPTVAKIGNAVGSALVSHPKVAAAPGGIMRTVVAGALEAMNSIGASLGDVAAVGKVPLGGGALTGIARTLQARQQRLTQEKRDQLLNAEANIRLRREQQLLHQADEEDIDKSIAEGQKEIEKLRTAPLPSQQVAEGTADELRKMMADQSKLPPDQRTLDPTTVMVIPSGKKIVGFDKNNEPIEQTVYTVMRPPKEITLTDSPKDKQFLSDVKKYTDRDLKPGQVLTGAQYNFLRQQVNDLKTLETIRRIQLQKNEIEDISSAHTLEALRGFNSNTISAIIEALGRTGGDPIQAVNILSQEKQPAVGPDGKPIMDPVLKDGKPVLGPNGQPILAPRMVPKYPDIESYMRMYFGEKEWTQLRANAEKNTVNAIDTDAALEKKLVNANGEEAAAIAGQIREMLKDPTLTPERRARLTEFLNRATAAVQASETYATNKAVASESGKRSVDEEEVRTAAKNVVADAKAGRPVDLRLITSYRQDQRTELYNYIKKYDPDFNLAKLDSASKMYVDYTEGKTGQNIQSFGTFLEHAGEYHDAIHSLSANVRSKIANMTINQLRALAGTNAEYYAALAALEPVQKEFEGFLLNNRALYGEDRETINKIINNDLPIGAIDAVLNQMGRTVQARYNELDRRFKNTVGQSVESAIPLDPAAIEGAEKIGLDHLGDIKFKPKQTTQQTKQQAGTASKPAEFQPPAGATGIAPGSDGKMHFHDAQGHDLGIVPPELLK
jgi:hypothetical protein